MSSNSAIREQVERGNIRKLENAKARMNQEARSIEQAHQNRKADMKKGHEMEITLIQDENQKAVMAEAEKKEKVLTDMRTHLQKTTELTNKELVSLKMDAEKSKNLTQQRLSADREKQAEDHELYLADINHRMNLKAKEANTDGQNRIEALVQDKNHQFQNVQSFHDKKINDQITQSTERFQRDAVNYKLMKDTQDNQFKKERAATNARQQIDLAKMTDSHTAYIEKRDAEYRKALKEQDLFFEKKYAETFKGHSESFKGLEDNHKKVVNKMKDGLSQELVQSIKRSDDPFYQFTEMKPTLTHHEGHVEIKVAVPEHSKQDLRLTMNGKEAVLSFNRRYTDAKKSAESGTVNQVNKVESFTTRMNAGVHLNPKDVKSTYEGGVMTYVIKKA